MEENFEDIRSYRDHEVQDVIKRLISNPEVMHLMEKLLPPGFSDHLPFLTNTITDVFGFQDKFMSPIFMQHILPTFDTLTSSGLQFLDNKKSYLFISNHRDIVLDSAILNYFLHTAGFDTAEIAIGDNLLKEDWIKDLVRLNKSFIVRRGLDNTEMLKASRKLSTYIRDTLKRRGESVWIAQRAGRAKDGNDATHRGLVNMLYLSTETDILVHFQNLNIVPVSISYEFDPCDIRKTRELYLEKTGGSYEKAAHEDVESMKLGIVLPKGKGHIHFGRPLNEAIGKLTHTTKKSTMITLICEQIDKAIQQNYKLWPSNLEGDELMQALESGNYIAGKSPLNLAGRMEDLIADLEGDKDEIRRIFLSMYQQPLLNKRHWTTEKALIS